MDKIIKRLQQELMVKSTRESAEYALKWAEFIMESGGIAPQRVIESGPTIGTTMYINKINDSMSLLTQIDLNTAEMGSNLETMKTYVNSSTNPVMISIPKFNSYVIKPEYVTQLTKDMLFNINAIISGEKSRDDINSYLKTSPFSKVKLQVLPSYAYDDSGKNETRNMPLDDGLLRSTCIPFLRDFPSTKANLEAMSKKICATISEVEKTLLAAYGSILTVKKNGNVSNDVLNLLNYYFYNMNTGIDNIIASMTIAILNEINICVSCINSINAAYNAISHNMSSPVRESEDVAIPDGMVDSILSGNGYELLEDIRQAQSYCYYRFMNGCNPPVKQGALDFMISNISTKDDCYPYSEIMKFLDITCSKLGSIKSLLSNNFASPDAIFRNAKLIPFGENSDEWGGKDFAFGRIGGISYYQDMLNDKSNNDVLVMMLKELSSGCDACGDFIRKASNVIKNINTLREEISDPNSTCVSNDVVRADTLTILDYLEKEYTKFISQCCTLLTKRYGLMRDYFDNVLEKRNVCIDVDCYERTDEHDYVDDAIDSAIESISSLSCLRMEQVMEKYRTNKRNKLFGNVFTEAENENQEQKKEPTVQENKDQQTDADKQKNNDAAATKTGEVKTPEQKAKLSESVKRVIENIGKFFSEVLDKFVNNMKKNEAKLDEIRKIKTSVLERSFNGVELNAFPYDKISTDEILRDIDTVGNKIGEINPENISSYIESSIVEKLFPFLTGSSNEKLAIRLDIRYKGCGSDAEAKKEKYTGDQLKTYAEQMVSFCEDFYGGGYESVKSKLDELKGKLSTKIEALKNSSKVTSEMVSKNLEPVATQTKVFAGAVMNAYAGRGNDFYTYIKNLQPTVTKEENKDDEKKEENKSDEGGDNK